MVNIRVINIYKATHLPEEGWLQGCYICSCITGKTISHNPREIWEKTRFVIYMCHICQKLRSENKMLDNEYQSLINSYIYSNFVYRPVDP